MGFQNDYCSVCWLLLRRLRWLGGLRWLPVVRVGRLRQPRLHWPPSRSRSPPLPLRQLVVSGARVVPFLVVASDMDCRCRSPFPHAGYPVPRGDIGPWIAFVREGDVREDDSYLEPHACPVSLRDLSCTAWSDLDVPRTKR